MPGMFQVGIAAVIEDDDGQILVLRRALSKDFGALEWEPVSGRMESGESPVEAVHREILEETGLSVGSVIPFDTFNFDRNGVELVGIAFACRRLTGEVRLSPEHDRALWVSRAQLDGLAPLGFGASLERYWRWREVVQRLAIDEAASAAEEDPS